MVTKENEQRRNCENLNLEFSSELVRQEMSISTTLSELRMVAVELEEAPNANE
jgi:hypothetical protein